MKRFLIVICAIAGALPGTYQAAAQQAQAGATTTQWLYERCKSPDQQQQNNCSAYLAGSWGVLAMMGTAYQDPQLPKAYVAPLQILGICPPSTPPIDGTKLRQVFTSWAENHPTLLSKGIIEGVKTAFGETWPCVERTH
jgi:Rap1a immunity proteins